ncbi:hypothetical protein GOBAR_AA32733 [Gossypium barbadense]|uniref:UVR domain-containing protein n=1 Tax=Gossypium barbadense TaxID=3634 RepID=A0A2P5WA41_GOSBA|nr:hypothetical protein GOBAR_AA32733 [Gossypium barbadense]
MQREFYKVRILLGRTWIKGKKAEMEMAGGGGITENRNMEMDVDDMDSLFEGMVLFTPSQLQHQGIQEPLDENLFSDLVLQTPLDQPELQPEAKHEPEPGPPSATAFARQTSSTFRKKKKATGFRIGYDDRTDDNLNGHNVNNHVQPSPSLHTSATTTRKDSIRRRRKAADDLHLATIRHGELEKRLEDACEAEDFEAADRINESLAAADKDKQSLLTALRDAEAQCNAIDSKMLEVLNCQIAVEEECATLLHGFSEDAMSNADSVFKKSEAQSSEEWEKWLSSTEALELNKIELQIEAHLVDNARAAFNSSLDSLIEDDKREKEFLYQRIADTISGFQEMQSSIDSKYESLQSHLSQMGTDSETLSKKKEEIDKLLAEEKYRGIKLKELAEISVGEAKMYQEVVGLRKSLLSSVLKSMEDKVRLAKTEEKLSKDVQILQLEASTARASLQELSSTKSSIQQNIASLKQRVYFIDKMVPELEAEKKVAAASRNFKEAARLAAEAKSLSTEKESVQIEMDKAVLDLGKLEEEIKCTVDKLQEIEGLILSKEKELAMARFQRLLLIAGAATAERSAALELGDEEEANLLLAEADAANSEAKELQPKYNLKEEEFEDLPKHFISLELVTRLGCTKLADLAAMVDMEMEDLCASFINKAKDDKNAL